MTVRREDLEAEARALTAEIRWHQQEISRVAGERAQVFMRLQRAGYSSHQIGRLLGISQPAVSQATRGVPFRPELAVPA